MFKNLRIGPRLIILITIQLIILLAIGAIALFGLNQASRSTNQLNSNISEGTRFGYLTDEIRGEFLTTVHGVNNGILIWRDGRERVAASRERFESQWNDYTSGLSVDELEFVEDTLGGGIPGLRHAFEEVSRLFQSEDRSSLELYVLNDLIPDVQPFLDSLTASSSERQMLSEETFQSALKNGSQFLNASLIAIVAGVVLAAILGFLIYRSIARPITRISETVQRISEGAYEVRSELSGRDELGQLGQAFDGLLDERVASLVNAERENEQLNDSVAELLDGVSKLSDRDLTVQLPISPDVTGPVADAINFMAEETAEVLRGVTQIAAEVESASNLVDERAIAISDVANRQQKEIESTASQLADAARSLNRIAEMAGDCDRAGEQASSMTLSAVDTVRQTLSGMNDIRDAIQETGKRLKRLGERSNEISGIVDIINTISERTHVLALNASMQAASAGEAGRGFGVVANEVQRLAESAREATAQISALVRNIQIDTNDTIATMDRTISQVVEGTQFAEEAGNRMTETQATTTRLVESVKIIADGSRKQAEISERLRSRAGQVVEHTRETGKQIIDQLTQTRNLVEYAQRLLSSVRAFKLPGSNT